MDRDRRAHRVEAVLIHAAMLTRVCGHHPVGPPGRWRANIDEAKIVTAVDAGGKQGCKQQVAWHWMVPREPRKARGLPLDATRRRKCMCTYEAASHCSWRLTRGISRHRGEYLLLFAIDESATSHPSGPSGRAKWEQRGMGTEAPCGTRDTDAAR